MKTVNPSCADAVMRSVIQMRYGRLDVATKSEKAGCSLTVVSKLLGLPYSEVRRLYRKFFRPRRPSNHLSLHHKRFLVNQSRLQNQTCLTLPERVLAFNRQFPNTTITLRQLRQVYKHYHVRKKAIRMKPQNPKRYDS